MKTRCASLKLLYEQTCFVGHNDGALMETAEIVRTRRVGRVLCIPIIINCQYKHYLVDLLPVLQLCSSFCFLHSSFSI